MNNGTSRICIMAIAFICALTSCAPPIGKLWESETPARVLADSLWTVPHRVMYDTTVENNRFVPSTDMLIFTAHEGLTYAIPVEDVTVQLCRDPGVPNPVYETLSALSNGTYFRFQTNGRYLIRVVYGDRISVPYSIQVGPLDEGEHIPGGGGPFEIIWRITVRFNANADDAIFYDGSRVYSQRVLQGARVTAPATPPTRLGYIFSGWYNDAAANRPYNFSFPVTMGMTLYAGWNPQP